VLVASGLVSVAAATIRARRRAVQHEWEQEDVHPGRWLGGLAVVAAAGAVPALWGVKLDIDRGFPTVALPLLGAGLVVAALGSGLLAWGAGRPGGWGPPGRARRTVAPGVSVVIAVGVLATTSGAAWWVEHRFAVDATTAPAREPVELSPPGEVAWVREVPGTTGQDPWYPPVFDSRDPVAAGSGLILEHSDGVTALDARTGEERWRYRRPGAERIGLSGSPAGTWAVLALVPGGDPDDAIVRYVVLDGDTGEVATELERRPGGSWRGVDLPAGRDVRVVGPTDHTLVLVDETEASLVGVDPETARPLWRWHPPEGCDFDLHDPSPRDVLAADAVVLSGYCGDDAVTVGVDDRTGSEAWRHTVADRASTGLPVVIGMSAGRDAAWVSWDDRHQVSRATVVDTATGDELFGDLTGARPEHVSHGALIDQRSVEGDGRRRSLTYRVVEAGGRSTEVTLPDCGTVHPHGVAVVESALVVACSGAGYETPPTETEPTVRVVPLDDLAATRVIDIEPDAGADTIGPNLNDPPTLLALPGVLVVAWDGGTRITALG
jgi:outer membrane protein assembly factor BamB